MPIEPHPDWLRPDWDLPRVNAFMTTRTGGVSEGLHASMNVGTAVQDVPEHVAANRARVSQALQAHAVFIRQVHGADVLHLRPEHAEPGWVSPPADASISTTPGLGVAIQVADCLPVLFAAPGGVGGAHAGWRGLATGVLENTVAALSAAAGCEPGEIQAWMGACIGPEAFEVGADVLQAFGADPARPDPRFFVYRPNAAGEPRWRANLVALARQRLQDTGLRHISGGAWCTHDSRFFSYRREPLAGRMVAAISLR
nr:peptidoglycan editing factor PgeF [uncultured Roseateles sp.]